MDFLRRFSFGGCLADDMGVGKTAQVLALLEAAAILRAAELALTSAGAFAGGGSRSLVFNWKQEAARFTPQLRVLDYTGLARDRDDFAGYDLILTTYGTLRRDAAVFQGRRVRLRGARRSAGDQERQQRVGQGRAPAARRSSPGAERHARAKTIWANCGASSSSSIPACSARPAYLSVRGSAGRNRWNEGPAPAGQALRPFILRRTKEQVAPTARQNRADHSTASWNRRSASSTTSCASTIAIQPAQAASRREGMASRRSGARSAAAAAPGRLPSRPDRQIQAPASPAPSSTRC
jgi:hypothetical protein